MPGDVDAQFEVEQRWKEEVVYWEGHDGFLFDAGWGVDPPVLYVPSAEIWSEVMPAWCRLRRDEVVTRLRARSGHTVLEDAHGYYRAGAENRFLKR